MAHNCGAVLSLNQSPRFMSACIHLTAPLPPPSPPFPPPFPPLPPFTSVYHPTVMRCFHVQANRVQQQMIRDPGVSQLLRLVKVKYDEEHGRVMCLEVVRTLALLTHGSSRAKVRGTEGTREGVVCVEAVESDDRQ